MSNLLQRVKDTSGLIKAAGETANDQRRHVLDGQIGCWDMSLKLYGLDAERRKLLAEKINEYSGQSAEETPFKTSDQSLELRAISDRTPLQGAALMALVAFADFLRQAGATSEELINADCRFDIMPTDRPMPKDPGKRGWRQVLACGFFKAAHGVSTAQVELEDLSIRQKHGDHSYQIDGGLFDLGETAGQMIEYAKANLTPERVPDIQEPAMALNITVDAVGTSIGALLLMLKKLDPMLRQAPPTATLRIGLKSRS